MPYYKIEFNVELDDEFQAMELESKCYELITSEVNYEKVTVDVAYKIDGPDD